MWRRWNERGNLGRLEFWRRAGVYVLLAYVLRSAGDELPRRRQRRGAFLLTCRPPWAGWSGEGITNIIRHSDATACTIELHLLDSPGVPRAVTLSMDNDRVHTLGRN